MADIIGNGREPRRPDRVLSLSLAPSVGTVVRRLPTAVDPVFGDAFGDYADETRADYAIELPDRAEGSGDLRWDLVRRRQLVGADIAMPATALRVSAGFVYRCGAPIAPTPHRPAAVEQFAALCDTIRSACAGWSVGLLVVEDDVRSLAAPDHNFSHRRNHSRGSLDHRSVGAGSVYALSRSSFVDAKTTPPHLFELTFSYVGDDDEVRSQSAYGSDALTSPVAAVSWLVQELSEVGRSLEPGDTVFSGGVTSPVAVVPGGTYRVVSSSLGLACDFGVSG